VKKRIVLYHPQSWRDRPGPPYCRLTHELPLALLAIGAHPLADGYEVVIVDGSRFEPEEAHRRAAEACEGALLYATTGILGWQVADALRCTRAVKARHPKLPAFIGGWFASVTPEMQLATGLYDAVAIGQGEMTFRDVVGAVDSGAALDSVPGLAIRRDGQVVRTAPRTVVGWDKLLDPPWHLLDPEPYRAPQRLEENRRGVGVGLGPGRPLFEISYYGSFGCPVACTFCCSPGFSGLRWKAVPAARMVEDLAGLQERWGFDGVHFSDANFGVSEARVREFCEGLIARRVKIGWFAFLQADSILRWKEETLDLLAEAGLFTCLIGGETGDEATMAGLKKPTEAGENLAAAAALDRRGVECVVSYMIGLPGESEDSMRASLAEARTIALACPRSRPEVWPYRPIPGTVDYERSLALGWRPPSTLEEWAQAGDYWNDLAWPGRIPEKVLRDRALFMHYSSLAQGGVRNRIGVWERRAQRHLRRGTYAGARMEARLFHVVDGLRRSWRERRGLLAGAPDTP
jgi:radical SAM superfamily enzyme YgiQ (UPF0313 family)